MAFDPDKFMNSAAAPMPTQMQVCPEGEWLFTIDTDPKQLTPKNISGVSQRTGNAYNFHQLELMCWCQSPEPKQKLGREKLGVRLRINLDLDENGGLIVADDKNVALGRLRTALDQNTPDWTPKALLGAGPFRGMVKVNDTDSGKFADITRVTKM